MLGLRNAGRATIKCVVPAPPIILFDGVCNVCNRAVNFILDRDSGKSFRFASLQSDLGRRLCAEHGVPDDLTTLILVEDGAAYVGSDAAVRIARRLDGPVRLLAAVAVVPRPLREAAYRYFATHRYAWFGRTDSCRVPTPEIRERFLS